MCNTDILEKFLQNLAVLEKIQLELIVVCPPKLTSLAVPHPHTHHGNIELVLVFVLGLS